MQLRYETSASDQIAKLERFAIGSVISRRFLWFAYIAICSLAWLSAVLFYVKQGDRNRGYLAYGALAAALTVSLPWLYRWYQRSFWASVLTAESLRGIVGPTILTVEEEFIEEAGPVMIARRAWRDVLRIEHSAERTLVFLAPLIAVAIPRSAFPNEAACEEVVRAITQRFEASRPSAKSHAEQLE